MTNYRADFLPREALEAMPFKALGTNVLIHERVTIVGIENLSIGSNVRIDPEVIILATGPVTFGDYVHIAPGAFFAGKAGIELCDFASVAHGSRLYSINDDYSGDHLLGPMVPGEYVSLHAGALRLERCAQVGAGSIITPGVTMREGSVLGALSLLTDSTEPWTIYGGVKARMIKPRRRGALEMARRLKPDIGS